MRTLVVTEFVSLDGVVDSPGGEAGYRHSGWTFDVAEDPAVYAAKAREQEEAEAMLLGARSYEAFAAVWPAMDYFARFNAMPKYVVSTTLTDPEWHHTSVLRSLDEVAELRAGEGGPIYVQGSATLAQGLLRAGLVDQLNLMVFPVVLGSGKRLFSEPDGQVPLALASSEAFSTGVVHLTYTPAS